jgi:hypothetical protein
MENVCMAGVLVFLGLLLLLGGGAVAGLRFVPVDLSFLDAVSGAKEFLASDMALYAGGGGSAVGLLLVIVGFASGGSKKAKAPARAPREPERRAPPPQRAAAPQSNPTPKAAAAPPPAKASAKPSASAKPPGNGQDGAPTWTQDPRLINRKRVSDIVSINDALKAYHKKNGKYPKADGLKGFADRGKAWIPGLAPEFITELPRDPAESKDRSGPQYVYASDGTDYKLLAHGVSLVGGTNVEVLGVKIDASKSPSAENAAFGFWTAAYEKI